MRSIPQRSFASRIFLVDRFKTRPSCLTAVLRVAVMGSRHGSHEPVLQSFPKGCLVKAASDGPEVMTSDSLGQRGVPRSLELLHPRVASLPSDIPRRRATDPTGRFEAKNSGRGMSIQGRVMTDASLRSPPQSSR